MERRSFLFLLATLAAKNMHIPEVHAAKAVHAAEALRPVLRPLPEPNRSGGIPLMEAIAKRRSDRAFGHQDLPDQVLSDILWAAYGVNRPDSGKRTVPTALNRQEIDVYAALAGGFYIYEPQGHALRLIVDQDLRYLTGVQPFVGTAPLNLVYVLDQNRSGGKSGEDMVSYASFAAGAASQNVYLYCASQGLNAVVRAYIDREALGQAMKLGERQRILFSQTVGMPG